MTDPYDHILPFLDALITKHFHLAAATVPKTVAITSQTTPTATLPPPHRPLLILVSGPQGIGKSTLVRRLATTLESRSRCRVTTLSIDDFYLTRDAQVARAQTDPENALMQQRGPPGTHDVGLLRSVLERMLGMGRGRGRRGEGGEEVVVEALEEDEIWLPRYDKSLCGGLGDRAGWEKWMRVRGKEKMKCQDGGEEAKEEETGREKHGNVLRTVADRPVDGEHHGADQGRSQEISDQRDHARTATTTQPSTAKDTSTAAASAVAGPPPIGDVILLEGWCIGFRSLGAPYLDALLSEVTSTSPRSPPSTSSPNRTASGPSTTTVTTQSTPSPNPPSTKNPHNDLIDEDLLPDLQDLQHVRTHRPIDIQRMNAALLSYEPIWALRDALIHLDAVDASSHHHPSYTWRAEAEMQRARERGAQHAMTPAQTRAFVDAYMPAYELYVPGLRRWSSGTERAGKRERKGESEREEMMGEENIQEQQEEGEIPCLRLRIGRDRLVVSKPGLHGRHRESV